MESAWGSPIYNCWLTTTLNKINNMIIGKKLFVRSPVLPYLELEEKIFISFKVKLKSVLKIPIFVSNGESYMSSLSPF